MPWIYLFIAGLSEIGWAFGLKYSKGFTEPVPSVITLVLIIFSFILFSKSLNEIPIGTAYAVFTGIGAAGTVLIGMLFLNEEGGLIKVLLLVLLIGGIIGLKATSKDEVETVKEN
ncbi:multidrug efflux SMR transporter [Bacillus sp. 31A1R]|uniref:Multidrug efflux SMR transporter n=1 Tax=Robertmurraya mangrovi TaxID=3098077 RepID=A0ABU5J489_9BACI|nr:multidrug efflux SMR transporter [Bacillus sp. 31A1R]MDZ5474219.1 multidrug efflux SMR transporter [Bacillus sp. 31A1R]